MTDINKGVKKLNGTQHNNADRISNAQRIMVFTKDELKESFRSKYLEPDKFNVFLNWHTNIELLWIDKYKIDPDVFGEEIQNALETSDFALFDNNILLSYKDNILRIESDTKIIEQIFKDNCNHLKEIIKNKDDIKKLYLETRGLENLNKNTI